VIHRAIGKGFNNNGLQVNYCSECELHHQFPLPEPDEVLARYFEQEPYSDEWLDKEIAEHGKGYWQTYYQFCLNEIGNPNLVLDVGAGAGWFVEYCGGEGVEPSAKARLLSASRGIGLFRDFETVVKRVPLPVDAIRAALVLEHIHNPLQFVKGLRPYLKTGGTLQIVVPNEMNPLQPGTHWIAQDHINYFTPETLRNLLHKAGFRVISEATTCPIELAIKIGLDYRHRPKLGRWLHNRRLDFEKAVGLRAFELYRKMYQSKRWGRELIFTARMK